MSKKIRVLLFTPQFLKKYLNIPKIPLTLNTPHHLYPEIHHSTTLPQLLIRFVWYYAKYNTSLFFVFFCFGNPSSSFFPYSFIFYILSPLKPKDMAYKLLKEDQTKEKEW